MNRFSSPAYISNSLKIKSKKLKLKSKFGKRPYEVFKNKVEYSVLDIPPINYHDRYISFDYFDLSMATKYYEKKPSLIHSIMLALIEYNEQLTVGKVDKERMIELGHSISKQATYIDTLPHLLIHEDFRKFNVKGKVYSGIIQAKAASLFIRVYKSTGNEKYLRWAEGMLLACIRKKKNGGILIQNDAVKSWVEEYNSPDPSMVLNGFIFVLIATAELLSCTDNYDLQQLLQNGLESLNAWIPYFKQDDTILYSMYHWDLCNVHYMGVLDYQLTHLVELVPLDFLKDLLSFIQSNYNQDLFSSMIS